MIAAGLAAAFVSFVARYRAEARNRAVELVIDWPEAQALANTRTREMDDVLSQLHRAGITTVAVTEETLESLHTSGIITYQRQGPNTLVTFGPGFGLEETRAVATLRVKTKLHITAKAAHQYLIDAPWPQFNGTPIGLDDAVVRTVRRNNLLVAPRLYNYTGATAESIRWELGQAQAQCGKHGLGPFIFTGAAVLGYRGHVSDTAAALRDLGLNYGSVEFAKTFGDDVLSRDAAANTVRVHSIGVDEMGTMEEPTAVERFVLGAKERNIRVCYIRLFVNGLDKTPDATAANTQFVGEVKQGIELAGLKVQGPAHPYRANGPAKGLLAKIGHYSDAEDPVPGRPLRALMAVGIAAAFVLLILVFTGMQNRGFWPILIVTVLVALGLSLPESTAKGREVLALLAACTFPTLALCLPAIRPSPTGSSGGLGRALIDYLRITLVTIAGAIFVVGLLNGRLFYLKVDEFLGVKAVLIVPFIMVAKFYLLGLCDLDPNANLSERWLHGMGKIRDVAGRPLNIGTVVASVVVLAVIVLLVIRSGNDAVVAVSTTELKLRALLDHVLGVRPRTKEFLFGHPALFVALALAAAGRRSRWMPALLIAGIVGQSSLLDTFCHLHTPLKISLLRAMYGWIAGGIVGLLAARVVLRRKPPAEETA